jgi:hypothetical protein
VLEVLSSVTLRNNSSREKRVGEEKEVTVKEMGFRLKKRESRSVLQPSIFWTLSIVPRFI